MFQVSKEFWFCAAHRLEGHPKCGRLHGHNYKVTVFMVMNTLENGMVIDFGDLKEAVKPIIDSLDHMYLISEENVDVCPYAHTALNHGHATQLPITRSTAEELSFFIHSEALKALRDLGYALSPNNIFIQVEETVTSRAWYYA